MKYKNHLHTGFTMLLVFSFFIGAVSKLIPSLHPLVFDNTFLGGALTGGNYERPVAFQLTLTGMQQSGFLIMIGLVQLLCCMLMLVPRTRTLGLLILLPMTFNIFMMQVLMNNSPAEIVKCVILLFINIILVAYYHKRISFIWRKNEM